MLGFRKHKTVVFFACFEMKHAKFNRMELRYYKKGASDFLNWIAEQKDKIEKDEESSCYIANCGIIR